MALRNLITDVAGILAGNADDTRVATGTSVVLFEEPAVASVAILGGAPGSRDTALLEPEMTVERVDAIVLSGGSAYGLEAAGGVMPSGGTTQPLMEYDARTRTGPFGARPFRTSSTSASNVSPG